MNAARRATIALILAGIAGGPGPCIGGPAGAAITNPAPRLTVYVGTYAAGGGRGIYRFEIDPATGEATAPALAAGADNPSFLALHPNGHILYAVNEVGDFGGGRTGSVSAFTIDPATGDLEALGRQSSGGADPCHLVVDETGRNVLVANYTGGSVAVLPLDPGGRLRPATLVRQHAGSGPNRARQEGPHAHAILLDAAGRFAFSADLGADRIFIDRFDAAAGTLRANAPASVALDPGSGPRHLAWHPSGEFFYAISELASTVTAFRYAAGRGTLALFQTISTLPAGFRGANTAAEIAVSPDGRFLYASNRGDDSVALFAIDAATGRLASSGQFPSGGRTPRQFAMDHEGRLLLVANQDSGVIATFRLDRETGRPEPVGRPVAIPAPVCVLVMPPHPSLRPPRTGERP
jgi:6-phosphogluconolactonase